MINYEYKIKIITEKLKLFTVPNLKTSGIATEIIAKRILDAVNSPPQNDDERCICSECNKICSEQEIDSGDMTLIQMSDCCHAETFWTIDYRVDDSGKYHGQDFIFPRVKNAN